MLKLSDIQHSSGSSAMYGEIRLTPSRPAPLLPFCLVVVTAPMFFDWSPCVQSLFSILPGNRTPHLALRKRALIHSATGLDITVKRKLPYCHIETFPHPNTVGKFRHARQDPIGSSQAGPAAALLSSGFLQPPCFRLVALRPIPFSIPPGNRTPHLALHKRAP